MIMKGSSTGDRSDALRCGSGALRKGRVSIAHNVYAVTTITANRAPIFNCFELGRIVVNEMRNLHQNGYLDSLAFVVMPDHLHWLFQLGDKESLSIVMKRFKGKSAMAINKSSNRAGAVWQPGFHDHGVREEDDLREFARYVIANPLRAGLVERIGAYPLWDAVWLMSNNSPP